MRDHDESTVTNQPALAALERQRVLSIIDALEVAVKHADGLPPLSKLQVMKLCIARGDSVERFHRALESARADYLAGAGT